MVYAMGGWWTIPRHIEIPKARAGDQLNAMSYVKNQKLTEYVGAMVNIACLSDMYGGDMRHTEPRYIESPRDVYWGSGSVALQKFFMSVPFL